MADRVDRKLRVLVVDDEPSVCTCMRLMLAFDGHEAVTVGSGQAALAEFQKGGFDLVFTDYSMPGMKGDQLAAAIKSVAPHQPILMISAYAPLLASLPAVDLLLGKPFMLEELRLAMARLLSPGSFAG